MFITGRSLHKQYYFMVVTVGRCLRVGIQFRYWQLYTSVGGLNG